MLFEPERGRFGEVVEPEVGVDVEVVVEEMEPPEEAADAAEASVAAGCFILVNFKPAGRLG